MVLCQVQILREAQNRAIDVNYSVLEDIGWKETSIVWFDEFLENIWPFEIQNGEEIYNKIIEKYRLEHRKSWGWKNPFVHEHVLTEAISDGFLQQKSLICPQNHHHRLQIDSDRNRFQKLFETREMKRIKSPEATKPTARNGNYYRYYYNIKFLIIQAWNSKKTWLCRFVDVLKTVVLVLMLMCYGLMWSCCGVECWCCV